MSPFPSVSWAPFRSLTSEANNGINGNGNDKSTYGSASATTTTTTTTHKRSRSSDLPQIEAFMHQLKTALKNKIQRKDSVQDSSLVSLLSHSSPPPLSSPPPSPAPQSSTRRSTTWYGKQRDPYQAPNHNSRSSSSSLNSLLPPPVPLDPLSTLDPLDSTFWTRDSCTSLVSPTQLNHEIDQSFISSRVASHLRHNHPLHFLLLPPPDVGRADWIPGVLDEIASGRRRRGELLPDNSRWHLPPVNQSDAWIKEALEIDRSCDYAAGGGGGGNDDDDDDDDHEGHDAGTGTGTGTGTGAGSFDVLNEIFDGRTDRSGTPWAGERAALLAFVDAEVARRAALGVFDLGLRVVERDQRDQETRQDQETQQGQQEETKIPVRIMADGEGILSTPDGSRSVEFHVPVDLVRRLYWRREMDARPWVDVDARLGGVGPWPAV